MRIKVNEKLFDWLATAVSYLALPITYPLMLWRFRDKKDKDKTIKYK
jgi:hypothetical protein